MDILYGGLAAMFALVAIALVLDYARKLRRAGASPRVMRASLFGAGCFYGLPAALLLTAAVGERRLLVIAAAMLLGTLASFRLGGSPFVGTPTAEQLERYHAG